MDTWVEGMVRWEVLFVAWAFTEGKEMMEFHVDLENIDFSTDDCIFFIHLIARSFL